MKEIKTINKNKKEILFYPLHPFDPINFLFVSDAPPDLRR